MTHVDSKEKFCSKICQKVETDLIRQSFQIGDQFSGGCTSFDNQSSAEKEQVFVEKGNQSPDQSNHCQAAPGSTDGKIRSKV